jgi:hypothetical protein
MTFYAVIDRTPVTKDEWKTSTNGYVIFAVYGEKGFCQTEVEKYLSKYKIPFELIDLPVEDIKRETVTEYTNGVCVEYTPKNGLKATSRVDYDGYRPVVLLDGKKTIEEQLDFLLKEFQETIDLCNVEEKKLLEEKKVIDKDVMSLEKEIKILQEKCETLKRKSSSIGYERGEKRSKSEDFEKRAKKLRQVISNGNIQFSERASYWHSVPIDAEWIKKCPACERIVEEEEEHFKAEPRFVGNPVIWTCRYNDYCTPISCENLH